MWKVRDRITTQVLTFTADSSRAHEIAPSCQQLDVRWDRAGSNDYSAAAWSSLGQLHRIDHDAHAALVEELDQLAAAHRASCNA
jgi:hypothetical protein